MLPTTFGVTKKVLVFAEVYMSCFNKPVKHCTYMFVKVELYC